MKVTHYLLGYDNLKIIQDSDMFNFSIDSVLLPNFATINTKTKKILDIGCGNAPIPLILSQKTNAQIIGVEIQKEVSEMARESVKINNLENQIEIINDDILKLKDKLETDSFDLITCNPPYFKVKDTSKFNKNDYKTIARHEVTLNLEQVLKIAKKLLKNDASIALVHRPERFVDIITLMRQNNLEPKKLRFVYPKKGQNANVILIEGTKNGKPGLKILEPLYIQDENGNYDKEITRRWKNETAQLW